MWPSRHSRASSGPGAPVATRALPAPACPHTSTSHVHAFRHWQPKWRIRPRALVRPVPSARRLRRPSFRVSSCICWGRILGCGVVCGVDAEPPLCARAPHALPQRHVYILHRRTASPAHAWAEGGHRDRRCGARACARQLRLRLIEGDRIGVQRQCRPCAAAAEHTGELQPRAAYLQWRGLGRWRLRLAADSVCWWGGLYQWGVQRLGPVLPRTC
jgi:hypothetical protein